MPAGEELAQRVESPLLASHSDDGHRAARRLDRPAVQRNLYVYELIARELVTQNRKGTRVLTHMDPQAISQRLLRPLRGQGMQIAEHR
jgi:hypothetical protein